jgi:hypothetical protein
MDRPAAMPYHRGRIHQTVLKPFANAGTRVPVKTHLERRVQKARTPTTRAPSPAFPAHPVHFPTKKEVLNAKIAPRGIYNPNQNNLIALQSKLGQSSLQEDLPRSSYRSGLKLIPMLHLVLRHARLDQRAVIQPMNRVKIARLANPVPKEPPNANRVAKESSAAKRVPPAKSAKQVPFKIKAFYQVPLAERVQLVGRPKTAVQNVSRVARVRLARGVKIAPRVMPEAVTTRMLHNANNACWVKQQRFKVLLIATCAMLEHLAKPKVFAKIARLVFIKIPKVKPNAVTFAPRLKKYPTKNVLGVNCHRGVLAKWANI